MHKTPTQRPLATMLLTLAFIFVAVSASSMAQTASTPPMAPLPAAFVNARTAFLGCGGAPALAERAKIAADALYSSFYTALTAQNLYQVVNDPSAADLAMEASIVVSPVVVPGAYGEVSVQLVVRDRKTQALVWTFYAPLKGAFREAAFRRNVDDASLKILGDLKLLASGSQPKP